MALVSFQVMSIYYIYIYIYIVYMYVNDQLDTIL